MGRYHRRKSGRNKVTLAIWSAVGVGIVALAFLGFPTASSATPAPRVDSPLGSGEVLATLPSSTDAVVFESPSQLATGQRASLLPSQDVPSMMLPAAMPTLKQGRLVDWPELPEGSYPPIPENSGEGRRIIYSKTVMQVWLIEADGAVVRWYKVSGKKSMPSPGTYHVYSKSRHATGGNEGHVNMQYMTRFAWGEEQAIGFHSIPTARSNGKALQTEAQLGQALSAGCVRQAEGDALKLWEFAPIGTQVVVIG